MVVSQDLLDEVTQRLKNEFDPEKILLFGSQAWGNPDESSDLDILIVTSKSSEKVAKKTARAHKVLRGLGISKDIIFRTIVEYETNVNLQSSLEYKIEKEGNLLYG